MNDDMLRSFAQDVPGLVLNYTIQPDGKETVRILNEATEEIWGLNTAEAQDDPQKIWDRVHREDLSGMKASVAASAADLSPWEYRWRMFDQNGSKKWLHGRGTPKALPDGSICWLTFIFDVSSQIEARTEATKAMDQLAIAMEAIPDGFAIFDENERFVTCNPPFREIHSKCRFALVKGASFEGILRAAVRTGQFKLDEADQRAWFSQRVKNFRRATMVEEVQLHDGRWMRLLERPTSNGGRVAFSVDITRSKKRQFELETAALTDPLTGLLNRRGLSEKVSALKASIKPDQQIAFVHIDLDRFKTVNDGMGHEAGDYVLTTVAQKLTTLVAKGSIIARVGGDEFVLVYENAPKEVEVFKFAERLRALIMAPSKFKERICQVGASVGISFWCPNKSYAIEQALLDADTALMQGKAGGRNRSIIFREIMRTQAIETANIAGQIKKSLKQKEFVPYFQPQIEWPSGRLCGFEALVRWKRPDGKATPASTFISVANETGLVVDIDREMIAASFDALQTLRRIGLSRGDLSLNLSSPVLRSPDLVETILSESRHTGIEPSDIHIEIVESMLLEDRTDAIATNVAALVDAGFRIDLDEFGTGQSALANLSRFPIDRIKIDQSLISSIDIDPSLRAITEGIYGLCKRMNIGTVAAGIETSSELEQLSKIGFSVFQGYHLGRPMSFDDLMIWLFKRGDVKAFEWREDRYMQS